MKIKKISKCLLTSIQTGLILFAVSILYLSNERMGVMRSLIYRNEVYDRLTLKIKIIYILSFVMLMFIIFAIKTFKSKYYLLLIMINLISIIFVIKFNSQIILSYYVLSISLTLSLVIELIKCIVIVR